jgi:protein phosphatase 2C family protein 2/3
LKDDVLKPDITMKSLTSDDKFVILASDGVWSVMDAQQAVDLVIEFLSVFKNSKAASEELVDEALRKNAEDNVSVVVIWFQEEWDPAAAQPNLKVRSELRKKSLLKNEAPFKVGQSGGRRSRESSKRVEATGQINSI